MKLRVKKIKNQKSGLSFKLFKKLSGLEGKPLMYFWKKYQTNKNLDVLLEAIEIMENKDNKE